MPKPLLAEFIARAGAEDEVAPLILDQAEEVRAEEGDLVHEVYRDEDAFQVHLKGPYGGPFDTVFAPLIKEDASVLTFLVPVG
ncbi:putative quinol monooxygenase [Streptomyces sp. NPDC057280]|uniref:putative quinol monooxygenase n=1 Tax=Streptomyces sp. NPDC057280 TaxID=3346081 RepID=UPI00363E3FDB